MKTVRGIAVLALLGMLGGCAVTDESGGGTEKVGPVAVSEADAAELDELARAMQAALEAESVVYGGCAGEIHGACDPCLVGELVIDGVSHSLNPCRMSPCSGYTERLAELERFIDALAPPPG